MTLQIGMVGGDGIAIVGDTWRYIESRDRPWFGYHASKIRVSDSGRVAAACARTLDISTRIADEIFQSLDGQCENRRAEIERIGTRVANGHDAECLVAFADPLPSVFLFLGSKEGERRCEELYSCFQIGDAQNTAFFWVMRYWRSTLNIQQLVRLGSLTVVSAGKISSGSIGGLEVLTCDKSGFQLWTKEQNEALASETAVLLDQIGNVVLGRPD
jgi:hypothetical protein